MDINAIAEATASALVGAMATDAWTYVRTRAGNIIGRGRPNEEANALVELDDMRAMLTEASPESLHEVARDVKAELRGQIRSRLRNDPSFAEEFSALADEIASRTGPERSTTNVTQYGKSEGNSTFYQIGHDYHGNEGR